MNIPVLFPTKKPSWHIECPEAQCCPPPKICVLPFNPSWPCGVYIVIAFILGYIIGSLVLYLIQKFKARRRLNQKDQTRANIELQSSELNDNDGINNKTPTKSEIERVALFENNNDKQHVTDKVEKEQSSESNKNIDE